LKAEKSPTVDIEVTYACAYPSNKWLIMGTQGGLTGTWTELKWRYFDPKSLHTRKVETEPTPDRSFNQEKISWKEETWPTNKQEKQKKTYDPTTSSPYIFYQKLFNTIIKKEPLPVTPESVIRVMQVIDKCLKTR
jgi:hypothetical protein